MSSKNDKKKNIFVSRSCSAAPSNPHGNDRLSDGTTPSAQGRPSRSPVAEGAPRFRRIRNFHSTGDRKGLPYGTVTATTYDSNYRVTQTGIANTANLLYTYSSGNLSSVQRTNSANASQTYSFTYDAFGNMTSLKVGSQTLATYTYGSGNGLLMSQTYANGDSVSFTYDNLGRTKTATYSDGRVLTYTYNGEGSLHSVTETNGNSTVTYLYTYDSIGRLISSEQKEGTSTTLRTNQNYNEYNQLTKQGWQMGSTAYSETYTYNSADGSLNTMTTGVGNTLTMGYDGLRRLSTVTGGPFNRSYTYRDISSTATTMQVSQLSYPNLGSGVSFGYTYDNLGNISSYTAPGKSAVTYTYDNQGQLLSASGDTNYTYTYDTVGNILTANGHTYTYGNANWEDLLTAFDGETITYDASGNPISYYNGTRWAFTWNNGRSLTRAVSTTTAVDYTYDLSGLRTSKTVGDVTHNYLYAGGKLMRETYGSNTLDFFYDANGTPYALKYNGTVYYYVTNLQGDVIRIVDASGNTVASYEYDPYGKVISATGTLAEINPIRYRNYYYDTETGLYYLQSRYYDPAIGRFVNADNFVSTGQGIIGNNMFGYCGNNPIINIDADGKAFDTIFDILSLASSVAEVIARPSDPWAWAGLVGDVIDVAVPFVTGVGEATKAIKTMRKTTVSVITNVDDVIETARAYKNTADAASDVRKATGTYVVLYKKGENYVGKGGFERAITSAKEHLSASDDVSAIVWAPTKTSKSAFIAEYFLQTVRGVGKTLKDTFNKIWSPGRNKYPH